MSLCKGLQLEELSGNTFLSWIRDLRAKCLKDLGMRGQQQADSKVPCQGRDLQHKLCRAWVMSLLALDLLHSAQVLPCFMSYC